MLCFTLALLSGCGGGGKSATGGNGGSSAEPVPVLTPAEQTEVDKILATHGREAILYYLKEVHYDLDEELVLKYVKWFVSQGADINAKMDYMYGPYIRSSNIAKATPLDIAKDRERMAVVEYLVSVGAKSARE